MGALATTTTSVRPIASNVKLHSIEMWAPASVSTTGTETIAILWSPFPTLGAINQEFSDTTITPSRPAHLRSSPPANSAARFWCDDITNQTLLQITGPAHTVIDIHVSFMLNDSSPTSAVAVAAATVGRLYYQPLDGATDNLLPVSLQHTT